MVGSGHQFQLRRPHVSIQRERVEQHEAWRRGGHQRQALEILCLRSPTAEVSGHAYREIMGSTVV